MKNSADCLLQIIKWQKTKTLSKNPAADNQNYFDVHIVMKQISSLAPNQINIETFFI